MSDGLYVFFILLIALRESMKIIVSCRWGSVIISSALSMANDSAEKTEQELGSLYMYSTFFQITAAPTTSWIFEAAVYIFSLMLFFFFFLIESSVLVSIRRIHWEG